MASESIFLLEAGIEAYLRGRVTSRGGQSFKFQSPSNRGVPDRIVVAPGELWFVEVKAPKGELSKLQEIALDRLLDYGANVAVVRSKAEVDQLIEKIFDQTGSLSSGFGLY